MPNQSCNVSFWSSFTFYSVTFKQETLTPEPAGSSLCSEGPCTNPCPNNICCSFSASLHYQTVILNHTLAFIRTNVASTMIYSSKEISQTRQMMKKIHHFLHFNVSQCPEQTSLLSIKWAPNMVPSYITTANKRKTMAPNEGVAPRVCLPVPLQQTGTIDHQWRTSTQTSMSEHWGCLRCFAGAVPQFAICCRVHAFIHHAS